MKKKKAVNISLTQVEMNQKDLGPLIVGYSKKCEQDDKVPFIPYYLKQLILNFYPVFI